MPNSEVFDSNLRRLRSIVSLADNLAVGDFPHNHSRDALLRIRNVFQEGLDRLVAVSSQTDRRVLSALCSAELRKVFELFPLLGFVIRSTDVRNAFEIHRPFLRIVQRVLGPDSKLVISSEWNYSPFTFLPPLAYGLADIVMIGVPASESQNALILPLAGHELGHNAWAKGRREQIYGPEAERFLVTHIVNDRWPEFSECFEDVTKKNLTDIVGRQSWQYAWRWAMRQSEELFCDFLGLALFGESFLHASSYLLAPGLPADRDEEYPGSKQRAAHQAAAARSYGVEVPDDFVERFENEDEPSDRAHRLLLSLADYTTTQLVPDLARDASAVAEGAGLQRSSQEERERITDCFGKGVPAQHVSGIEAVVNAAWDFFLSGMSAWRRRYAEVFATPGRSLDMLSDLVFKTIEVHEIQARTGPEHARS